MIRQLSQTRNKKKLDDRPTPLEANHLTGHRNLPIFINMNLVETVDQYIEQFPPDVQTILSSIRAVIRAAAPAAKERISYRMPTYTMKKNLIHFAAFKNHIGLYPTPSGTEAFEKELSAYVRGKGSVQFPMDQPMPLDLIRRIVLFRVEEEKR